MALFRSSGLCLNGDRNNPHVEQPNCSRLPQCCLNNHCACSYTNIFVFFHLRTVTLGRRNFSTPSTSQCNALRPGKAFGAPHYDKLRATLIYLASTFMQLTAKTICQPMKNPSATQFYGKCPHNQDVAYVLGIFATFYPVVR